MRRHPWHQIYGKIKGQGPYGPMSLMVLRVFRHLPGGAGSSPSDSAHIFNAVAGTFALFGRLPRHCQIHLEELADLRAGRAEEARGRASRRPSPQGRLRRRLRRCAARTLDRPLSARLGLGMRFKPDQARSAPAA